MSHQVKIFLLLLWIVPLVSSCAIVRNGGGPPPSFDVETDLKSLASHFGSDVSIETVYNGGPTPDKRDRMIAGRLVMMNLRYIQFIKSINAEKQFIDTASDVLILSLNIAGVALTPQTTRTVLAALSAGVAGSKVAIDKNYFYEKTMPALVATMNSERKKVLLSILKGLHTPLEVYSVEQAITDLDAYYYAGTLIGAINAVQATAAEQEKETSKQIDGVTLARINSLMPADTRDQMMKIGDAIEKLTDLSKAKSVLQGLGYDVGNITALPQATDQLKHDLRVRGHDKDRTVKIKEMYDIFHTNSLL